VPKEIVPFLLELHGKEAIVSEASGVLRSFNEVEVANEVGEVVSIELREIQKIVEKQAQIIVAAGARVAVEIDELIAEPAAGRIAREVASDEDATIT
jgi:hypothetical protein